MRIVDILYSLPFMFFVIILMVVFGRNIILLFIALGAVEWLTMARIVRGQTLSVKRKEFIEAAHAAGVSNWRIVLRHIIPNVLGPGRGLRHAHRARGDHDRELPLVPRPGRAGALHLLGRADLRGGRPDGERALDADLSRRSSSAVTLFCFNFIGDGLRDALDPKDR